MLAQLHDVGARDLPSFGLKDIARHLGVAAADRTYVDASHDRAASSPSRPTGSWPTRPTTRWRRSASAPSWRRPTSSQAQLLPFDYQSATLRGAAAKIDALLVREYLRRGHAVPAPGGRPVGRRRAHRHLATGRRRPGAARRRHVALSVAHAGRAASRRPRTSSACSPRCSTTCATSACAPSTWPAVRAEPEERAHQHALQQTFKILINAFYGYLAFRSGHFNDFAAADRVTAEGRAVVTTIVDRLTALGAVPIEADTDGVYFVRAGRPRRRATTRAAGGASRPTCPKASRSSSTAGTPRCCRYKMKTYALLDERGRVQLKGSGFRSRGLEPFQRRLIEEVVRLLLEGKRRACDAVIDRWLDRTSPPTRCRCACSRAPRRCRTPSRSIGSA